MMTGVLRDEHVEFFVCVFDFDFGNGRAAGTGPPHPLGILIGYLIAGKDGFGSTAGCAG